MMIAARKVQSYQQQEAILLPDLMAEEFSQLDQIILDLLPPSLYTLRDCVAHILNAGGKRLRPLLTLSCSRLFGPVPVEAITFAAAVEMIHTATLLHDDVVDDGNMRRGRPTVKGLWGNRLSILVGDYLFAQAFNLFTQSGNMAATHMISTVARHLTEGELLQEQTIADLDATRKILVQVIEYKTASLFGAAAALGGTAAGLPQDVADVLYAFGLNLGIAFQIQDDWLDYMGSMEDLGKEPGTDWQEGKTTLPLLIAAEITRVPLASIFTTYSFPDIQDILATPEAKDQLDKLKAVYANKAIESLEMIPGGDAHIARALEDLVWSACTRQG